MADAEDRATGGNRRARYAFYAAVTVAVLLALPFVVVVLALLVRLFVYVGGF